MIESVSWEQLYCKEEVGKREKLCEGVVGRRLGEGAGHGGVSTVTLMNQCQWSDEKIIKKQASAVLNTAKSKRPSTV